MRLFKPLQRFFGGGGPVITPMIKQARTTPRLSSVNSTTYTILSGGLEITMHHHYDGIDGTNANTDLDKEAKSVPSAHILDSIRMYGRLANRTLADNVRDGTIVESWPTNAAMALNAATGLASEGGETSEIIKKWLFHGHPMDEATLTHLKKELGDLQWYLALMCYAMDFDDAEVLGLNIAKLRARYPDGFETERSMNRAPGDI